MGVHLVVLTSLVHRIGIGLLGEYAVFFNKNKENPKEIGPLGVLRWGILNDL